MGGLRTRMPVTFWTYLIGTLALAGIFPLAGFWSKDEILAKAFSAGFNEGKLEGYIALGLLLMAAGFTAFYMWRQICMVFLGQPRTEAAAHAPESNSLMTVPLIVLAFLSALGGLLNIPTAFQSLRLSHRNPDVVAGTQRNLRDTWTVQCAAGDHRTGHCDWRNCAGAPDLR